MKKFLLGISSVIALSACSTEGRLEMSLDGIVEDGTLDGKQVYAVLTGYKKGVSNPEQLLASQTAKKAAMICPGSYTVVGKYEPKDYSYRPV